MARNALPQVYNSEQDQPHIFLTPEECPNGVRLWDSSAQEMLYRVKPFDAEGREGFLDSPVQIGKPIVVLKPHKADNVELTPRVECVIPHAYDDGRNMMFIKTSGDQYYALASIGPFSDAVQTNAEEELPIDEAKRGIRSVIAYALGLALAVGTISKVGVEMMHRKGVEQSMKSIELLHGIRKQIREELEAAEALQDANKVSRSREELDAIEEGISSARGLHNTRVRAYNETWKLLPDLEEK